MQASLLRHRVTFRRMIKDHQDLETGDFVMGEVDIGTVWAQIVPLSVREFMQAAAGQSEVSTRIVVRYNSISKQVTTDDKVVRMESVYEILGILPDPKSGREYLTLVCKKVQ